MAASFINTILVIVIFIRDLHPKEGLGFGEKVCWGKMGCQVMIQWPVCLVLPLGRRFSPAIEAFPEAVRKARKIWCKVRLHG